MFGIDDGIQIGLGIFNGIRQRAQFDKWFKWVFAIICVYWWALTFSIGSCRLGGMDWGSSIISGLISAPLFSFATWLKSPLSKDVQIVIPTDMKTKFDTQPDEYTSVKGEGK